MLSPDSFSFSTNLAGALKDFFLRSVGNIYLFGVEIEDVEALRAKPERSGRDLAVGMDEAWYGAQIWRKN